MSVKSQEANMRKLADLLSQDLSYIYGKKESGPNGAKRTFLHVGRTFLRALAKDLGLRDYKITSHTEGIAVSGSCTLMGSWEEGGIYICLSQFMGSKERVMLYRTIRHMKDYTGGYNRWLSQNALAVYTYEQLLSSLTALRRDQGYERAA